MEPEKATRNGTASRRPFESARPPRRTEAGQSLLEFALMLPMVLLLVTGVAEIGRAAYYSITVSNAATAGVEYGAQDSQHAGDGNMPQAAVNDGNGIVTLGNTSATHGCRCDDGTGLSCNPMPADGTCANISCGSQTVVECVQVTTHDTFNPLFNWPGLPASYQANGNSVMRVRPPQQ